MANTAELQALLRFLSQDAKIPLASAMSKVKDLQKQSLTSPSAIAKADVESLNSIFADEKLAKQVANAAKRLNKKRGSAENPTDSPIKKKFKPTDDPSSDPLAFEESLQLPEPCYDENLLAETSVFTNRAPLFLAFAVTLLKYTMPGQPLSSRLSLAQAVVSANSRSKAVSIGLESGRSAEEEGFGEGQPTVTIMNREIRVMKRWGYDWKPQEPDIESSHPKDTQDTIKSSETLVSDQEPALWALDLEALKKSNSKYSDGMRGANPGSMPIYTAQAARAYLLKSFETPKPETTAESSGKKKTGAALAAEKERNLGLLLGALEVLYQSWASRLDSKELDKRSWSWYVRVRPDVQSGVAGWGGKNIVKLADILSLKRTP